MCVALCDFQKAFVFEQLVVGLGCDAEICCKIPEGIYNAKK